MNILSKEEAKELTEWLMENGLGLGECAYMMCNMECGDTFSLALLKVFNERKQKMEALRGHSLNKKSDNFVEELLEDAIEEKTGLDLDLTPETKESP